jgi:hypothetical protein
VISQLLIWFPVYTSTGMQMDGLIVELNHSSCYDMIEQFCDEIQKQLGGLQKQR